MGGQAFEELKTVWYAKLKEEGFEDIEHSQSLLKTYHGEKWRRLAEHKQELTLKYYSHTKDLLHTYTFENPTHRLIWELHSDGLSKRKIASKIESMTPTYKREAIGNIINFLKTQLSIELT